MNNYENNYEYNNYETNKKPLSHYIKKFLIAFLFIVIAMFLLLWLFPTKSDLNPLYDKIFNDNIQTMKEVAISYFTTERLPEKVGDTKKLTLEEMLEMKLLLAVKDKNGDMCDVDDSYVEITKLKNEYKMKVNLKCGEEEDYIIVYLGCYDYCLTDICEKKEETKKPVANKVVNKVEAKHYCAVVKGKYYDNKGKVVTKTAYEKACKTTPTKHYCAVVNGKYYDNKGKVVTKAAYEKACKKEQPVYKYLYKKVVTTKYDKVYSDWSDWSKEIEYNPEKDNINWGKHEYVWYEKTAPKTYTTPKLVTDYNNPIYQTKTVKIGTYTKWTCTGYEYFINKTTNTLYQTNGWQYAGTVNLYEIPADTNTTSYVYVDMYYENCSTSVCDVRPVYKFKKYTRTAKVVTSTKEELEAVCKVSKQNVDVYATVTDEFVEFGKKQIEVKNTVYYYHKKTRTLVKDAYTDTKTYTIWSNSKNDKSLIAQGYKYTGTYKKVN